jgi:hypothetical protein
VGRKIAGRPACRQGATAVGAARETPRGQVEPRGATKRYGAGWALSAPRKTRGVA